MVNATNLCCKCWSKTWWKEKKTNSELNGSEPASFDKTRSKQKLISGCETSDSGWNKYTLSNKQLSIAAAETVQAEAAPELRPPTETFNGVLGAVTSVCCTSVLCTPARTCVVEGRCVCVCVCLRRGGHLMWIKSRLFWGAQAKRHIWNIWEGITVKAASSKLMLTDADMSASLLLSRGVALVFLMSEK